MGQQYFHLPGSHPIICVVKWKSAQTWYLGTTLFTVAFTSQAFVSVHFRADKIFTWTPLILVIDAGSMAQVLFLVGEQFELLTRLKATLTLHWTTSSAKLSIDEKLANPMFPTESYAL